MQLYDFTIAINGMRQLDAPGNYFYYYAGSAGGADSTITLRGISSGLRIILKPGQAYRLAKDAKPEVSWVIGNSANAATILGSVIVGNGEITDNRITGSVEVIDGGKNRTLGNQAFLMPISNGALAANWSHVQLWNPVASGKNVIVEQIAFSVTDATGAIITIYNATLSNFNQNGTSKKSNGATSSAESRSQQSAVQYGSNAMFVNSAAQGSCIFKFSEPIILTPGYGLNMRPNVQNMQILSSFEFFEESV